MKYKINASKGIDILMDNYIQNSELLTAIGILVAMYAEAEKDYNKLDKNKLKEMLNAFVDRIYEEYGEQQ